MILMNTKDSAGAPGFCPDLSTLTLASLANAGVATLVFDLDHENYLNRVPGTGVIPSNSRGWRKLCSVIVAFANVVTSAGGSVKFYFSDDGTATNQIVGQATYNNVGGPLLYSGDLAVMSAQLLVTKRFLRVVITNGATPQGATAQCAVCTTDI